MKLTYRSDIDGLRAIAVLGVLFYHLDKIFIPGGFTGVDVFFVISGYLITSILTKEIQEGTFSIAKFYDRRIRRILPAYFFLLIVTTTIAYLTLTPVPLEGYGKAMSNSLFFISNFLFAKRIDYFAQDFNSSPLLHTWSLAVEEQFYLIWPLIIGYFGTLIFHRKFQIWFISFLAASLLLSEILLHSHPKLSFFMIYSRAWELGIGASIALPYLPEVSSKKVLDFLSRMGLILILTSLLCINSSTSFPGLSASFAVFGTALIIYTGKYGYKGYVHQLLAWKPLVAIGLISYSLYLWHWPLIIFAKYYLSRDLNFAEKAITAIISLIAAYFSYRYIETPFRKKGLSPPLHGHLSQTTQFPVKKSSPLFLMALSFTAIFLIVSIFIQHSKGLPHRFKELNQPNLYTINPFRKDCHLSSSDTDIHLTDTCGYNYGGKKALLWGDSHADHYMPALNEWANKNKIQLYQVSKSACSPLIGEFDFLRFSDNQYKKYDECTITNNKILEIVHTEKIEIIILASRWAQFFANEHTEHSGQFLVDGKNPDQDKHVTENIFTTNFEKMVNDFITSDKKIIILGQVPVFMKNPTECYLQDETPLKLFFMGDQRKEQEICSIPESELGADLYNSRQFFQKMSKDPGVLFFDPVPYFCANDICSAMQKDKILYHDTHHLNVEGGSYLQAALTLNLNLEPKDKISGLQKATNNTSP